MTTQDKKDVIIHLNAQVGLYSHEYIANNWQTIDLEELIDRYDILMRKTGKMIADYNRKIKQGNNNGIL